MRSLVRLLVATLLLLSLAPLPVASAASWSLDARVVVTGGTSADYTWTVAGLSNTNLTLPLPDDATFVEARDADGKKLSAGVVGDKVYVVSGSKPYTIRFALAGQQDGPFVLFPAQVAADRLSPVTVALALPSGWTLSGWRGTDEGEAPDASGTFRRTGPAYVQYLVLPAGLVDPGPDATLAGERVKREARASLTAEGGQWSLTTTYDTDVFRREWDVHVPEGATVTGASTPFGPLETSVTGDLLRVRTPYPVGFGLGARSFTVDMALPPPDPHGGAFLQANLSVRAADGDVVRVDVSLADASRYAGARVAGGREVAPLRFEGDGPVSVTLATLPPPGPGHVQFDEGLFVVDAPGVLLSQARATARNATAQLPRVADFAYDAAAGRRFFVSFTNAPVFGWEEGFYSNGLNTISIRQDALEGLDASPHLVPVGILVHEATHGLLDRKLPDVPHELSFLHEGLARLAETRLERDFPNEVIACSQTGTRQSCERHSARPGLEELREFHQAQRAFDTSWTASRTSEADRGFLYDYSGLVMHAYATRAPAGALPNALAHLNASKWADEPATDARTLVSLLLANAPGTSESALLYPGRELNALTPDQARHCLGALVAPAYPWEGAGVAPPGGCPATGYGGQTAPLPPPPAPEEEPEPVEPSPVVATPRPTFEVPTSFPTPADPIPIAPEDEAPGAVFEGGGDLPAAPGTTEVPGLGVVALVVVALAAARLTTRR